MNNKGTVELSETNRYYLRKEFSDMPEITEVTRQDNLTRFIDDVRLNNGLYMTDKEKEEYISESLKRELP